MVSKRATYKTRTEGAIKDALLKLLATRPLADITIAELAREAHVSRSTFYEHYGNPGDVYDELMGEISAEMAPIMSQVACSDGFQPAGKPFCEIVRDGGRYAPVVREARFVDSLIEGQGSREIHDLYELLADAGYTHEQARAVCSFQMSGCFNAARQARAGGADWGAIRPVIDRFILGGIAACLAAKR